MIQNELASSPTLTIPDRPAGSAAVQRRNWWLHVLEGGTLIGSWGAINANTVGTSLVQHLGGEAWMVALMPMATTVGFSLGPIFTAHRLDRQRHFLPVLRSTLPFSRLPILLSAVVLGLYGAGPVSLWAVLTSSLVYGLIGGASVGAWQQLILRTVPSPERPSLFATRYLASNLLGLAAGSLVSPVLGHWPGTTGYAVLHLVTFAGAMIAYRLLMGIVEPSATATPPSEARTFFQNLRGVPALFASDRRLGLYLWTVVLVNSQFLLMGFLAVHALEVLGETEAYVGTLTSAQMAGAVVGTFVAARFGNRYGSRGLLIAARCLFLIVALGALVAATDWPFRLLFAAYGAALWVNLVGHNTLTLELLPHSRRSTVLAVFSLVQVPSMLIAAQLGAWLWHIQASFAWIAGASAVGLAASLATMLPRRLRASHQAP